MMVFWLLAAGLIGLAMLFIVPPILRRQTSSRQRIDADALNLTVFRQQIEELDADLAAGNLDQAQYDSARHDLEKELLLDVDGTPQAAAKERTGRWAAPVLLVTVPAVALGMYLLVGDHQAIERTAAPPPSPSPQPVAHNQDLPSMEVLVARLAQRMQADPDNLEGWVMLGRSYLSLEQPEQAVKAYAQAERLAPEEPDVLVGYAESVAKVQGTLRGKPAELVSAALAVNPSHPNALWMAGLAEFQQGNHAQAVAHWTRLERLMDPGSEQAAALRGYIAQARQQGNLPDAVEEPPAGSVAAAAQTLASVPEASAAPATTPAPESAGGKSIRVDVRLAAELKDRMAPDDTLFVFARALNGPPMPLAVKRMRAQDLPASVSLDDSMAMMPQMRMSNFDQIVVGARVSKSGNAVPQGGDLEGEVSPIVPGQTETVEVLIDTVRP
jgi:cytochrome c-type biogenesis protein CcmH